MHAVRVTVIAPECLRIEYAPGGRFVDLPSLFAIHAPTGSAPATAPWRDMQTTSADGGIGGVGGRPIVIETERVRFEYLPDGRPPHAGNMRALVAHSAPPPDVPMQDGCVLWTPGAVNRHNLGGTVSTLDGLRDAVSLGDGLLARDGWSLIDDSRTHLLVDGWARTRESEGLAHNLDWYLFAFGEDFRAALHALAAIAGEVPLPRRCALGSWFSRYWPYTSAEFRGIADEYEVHGFPLDVMVLDMDWHREGWTGWSWNRELIPDPEDLLSWLHERRLAVTLNLHPSEGVGPHEDCYAEFMHALGRAADGSHIEFDAGDRAYMRALFDHAHRPLERQGVDFWWLDWQQYEHVRSIPGLTNLRWLNHLYFQHTHRAPGVLAPTDPGRRGLSFSRWAGLGDHRHPIHFSGDAHTGWPMLAFQVRMTVAAGNVGCFYWSHDIGGHFGPRDEQAATRWVQFGALSSVLRLHSARTAVLDRRPWTYAPRFCDAMRAAFHLRSRLFPAIYTVAAESSRSTVPLLRPMYLDHPSRDLAYRVPHQYMLGDDLLAAPIVEPGLGERCIAARHVYFPDSEWFDLETGERHGPEAEAFVSAAIDHVPVFARAGTPIPMRPVSMRMTSEPIRELVVRCFPGVAGQTTDATLYEDDGISMAHARGASATTALRIAWSSVPCADGASGLRATMSIGPTVGAFQGQIDARAVTIEIGVAALVLDARINGLPAPFEHDAEHAGGLLLVRVPERSIRERVEVVVEFRTAEPALVALRRRAADFSDAVGHAVTPAQLPAAVAAACRADVVDHSGSPDADRIRRMLAIGAGIGVHADGDMLRLVDTLGWIEGGRVEGEVVDRRGENESVRTALFIDRPDPDACVFVSEPRVDALEDPPLGLRATRLARYRFRLRGAPIVLDHLLSTRLRPLRAFRAAGPFAWDWRRSITEQVYDVEAHVATSPPMHTAALAGDKWTVDFRRTFPGSSGLGYASTRVLSMRRQSARLYIDSSDKNEAWLNGVKVYSQDGAETHAAALGFAEVSLEPGHNALLIKCAEGGGGWGFTASIEAAHALCEDAGDADSPPLVG